MLSNKQKKDSTMDRKVFHNRRTVLPSGGEFLKHKEYETVYWMLLSWNSDNETIFKHETMLVEFLTHLEKKNKLEYHII
ncbi:CLUMA_CG012734, isoform A [Clunio marinus]|uniref:CLUMA_CG012734, isoform A n=1 Tax=Clunio marinus TaxID=568069 RepID=A0A1J1IG85_9DIPT|nr:CLUMA_CG012734, isoform A [Clunio marinus]